MASLANDVPAELLFSHDLKIKMMGRNYERDDWRALQLNEALEESLSHILRYGYDINLHDAPTETADRIKEQIFSIVKHIADEIPGYNDWNEVHAYIVDSFYTPDYVPGENHKYVGTEQELHDQYFDDAMKQEYNLRDEASERAELANREASLATARRRLEILDSIPRKYSPDQPMPDNLAEHFGKIRGGYKLRETALSRIGYRAGSYQLAANMANDIDAKMLLIDLKMRRPDRMLTYPAPKPYKAYYTYPISGMPWNNQFSYAWGFDEFDYADLPRHAITLIERRLIDVARHDNHDEKWEQLCKIIDWDTQKALATAEWNLFRAGRIAPHGSFLPDNLSLTDFGFECLTLGNILLHLGFDEIKRRAFYTLFLGYAWSDTPLAQAQNPFFALRLQREDEAEATGKEIDLSLANLDANVIKDPKLSGRDEEVLTTLSGATRLPVVSGHKANLIIEPTSAAGRFAAKLNRLNEQQLDSLFANQPDYPKDLDFEKKKEAVVKQAVAAADAWRNLSIKNRRPIYTGVSGHMMSYARFFVSNASPTCARADHPNVDELIVALLTDLIGANQHHSYDECMFSVHGLEYQGSTFHYKDRAGFGDIIKSDSPIVHLIGQELIKSALAIGRHAIREFDEVCGALDPPLPDWRSVVKEWYKTAIGDEFPGEED